MPNAETDTEKDEILTRLGRIWKSNPELRLIQLIGNVYGVSYPYHRQDYDAIADIEDFYDAIVTYRNRPDFNNTLDRLMSCPCGRGDYDLCQNCPYRTCSVHGDTADKGAVQA